MPEKREEPQVILDHIIRSIRSNRRLDLEFKDHYNRKWILSMRRVEE